ncbi:MAG: TIGR04282 family arsenosugar biosynthesis glycosyltransferase [Desulfuromusa sp.]|nr:TIGR04282 family arsenosugar biosynthesis glycosyltransferase [Desulfuromusa sp.]
MNKTPDSNLLVFSKYPLAGKVKTRLIPALGAEVAAQLHRRLAESAIDMAQSWTREISRNTTRVTVHYTGAEEKDFCSWLGSDLDYQEQPAGNLGRRMCFAFESAFECGIKHVIGIGTDVPALTPALLRQADKNLKDHDVVLGPAADGGYYLIGMNSFHPELFVGIDWGTGQVYAQTQKICIRFGLRTADLLMLNDVDRPEDLRTLRDDPRFSDIVGKR